MSRSSDDVSLPGVLIAILLILPVSLWCGFVASVLWGWFIVPSLGAPQISTVPAAGMIMLLSFMHPSGSGDNDSSVLFIVLYRAFYALIALGFGAILHALM